MRNALLRLVFAVQKLFYQESRLELEAVSQRLIPKGEQSELQTRIAATESVTLYVRMKN
jgi:hypothetical protein